MQSRSFDDVFSAHSAAEGYWLSNSSIYCESGDVIGNLRYTPDGDRSIFISIIAIYKEFRNQGHFRSIVDLISRIADIEEYTVRLIPLPTNTDTIECSGIGLNKLQKIYSDAGFIQDAPEIEPHLFLQRVVCTYVKYPNKKDLG